MKKQSKYQEVVAYLKNASSLDAFRRVAWDFDRNKTWTGTTTPKEHTSLGAFFLFN